MVKDKVELCSSELSKFFAIEGVGGFPLFNRYEALRVVIESEVTEKYKHFLAQPVVNQETITWHCVPYTETPRHLNELMGGERDKYENIKDETIAHYNKVITKLKQEEKAIDCEYIEKALKSIDDRFIYCFDEKVVLAIWGMKPKNGKNRISGEYSKDLFIRATHKPKYRITFNSGEKGKINGLSIITKEKESSISFEEIPAISTLGEFDFIGWDENPLNYIVSENKTFNAQYKERTAVPSIEESQDPLTPGSHKVSFSAGKNGVLLGNSVLEIREGESLTTSDIPKIEAKKGYVFTEWNQNPEGFQVVNDTQFVAQYEKTSRSFWQWLRTLWSGGCLKWLILILLLLLLLWLLFKGCNGCGGHTDRDNDIGNGGGNGSGGSGDDNSGNGSGNGNGGDNGSGGSGDGNSGNGSGNGGDNGSGSGGNEFLPGNPGTIAPIDSINFGYSKDSLTKIVADRLNILIDGDANVFQFAKDFKTAYPSKDYQIVYYDTLIKRLQIKIPVQEREKIKQELPQKLPNYKLFIWDETLFESDLQLNDPALQDKNKSWQIDACQVREAWDFTLGSSGVVVAIVDDGFDLQHPEFKGKIVKPYNVWSKNNNVYPSIKNHGTHVAGIALAIGNNGIGIAGIAPNCKLMPVQVSDSHGNMTITSAVDGVLYAIYSGADVINVSLGMEFTDKSASWSLGKQNGLIRNNFKEEERLWKEVFRIADEHNTTIVLAAGNENILTGIDPLQRPSQAITVSAVDKAKKPFSKSSFSNFGEYSDLSAPGVQIYSTYGHDGYSYLDGTSMAAPIVTGGIALLKSINKKFTSLTIKNILVSTGIHIPGNVGNMIQLGKALRAASSGKFSKEDPDECAKIAREIDSLKKEIDKRLQKCSGLLKN